MRPWLRNISDGEVLNHVDINAAREWCVQYPTARNVLIKPNSGTPTTKLDIKVDLIGLRTSGGQYATISSSNLPAVNETIDIDTVGIGGVDSGEVASGQWYYTWVIGKDTSDPPDGIVDTSGVVASTNSVDPVMPAGYTHKRLVGCFLTEDAAEGLRITPFIQQDAKFLYHHLFLAVETGTISTPIGRETIELDEWVPAHVTDVYMRPHITGAAAGANFKVWAINAPDDEPAIYIINSTQDHEQRTRRVPCHNRQVDYAFDNNESSSRGRLYVYGFMFPPAHGVLR